MTDVVLLGAGASVDAGVPASTTMTEKIVAHINADAMSGGRVAAALNYAVGALVAHDTARGESPYAGVDVERLFAAIQMLGSRDAVEITPFVASWSPVLESLGSQQSFPAFFDNDFREAIAGDRPFKRPSELIKKAVAALVGTRDSEPTFRALEKATTDALRTLVQVDPAKVDYLAPLLNPSQQGPICIATLNYDRSIEELAARAGVACDTGISSWSGGHDWTWDPHADLLLLKLHGSIDWTLASEVGAGDLREARVQHEDPAVEGGWHRPPPALIFGARGKLRAEGPFLAMLRAFDDFLSTADSLLVVGYSFRDEHINTAIRRWVNAAPGRKLTVIDPAFPEEREWRRGDQTFADELLEAMTVRAAGGTAWQSSFRVLPMHAVSGLTAVLGAPSAALSAGGAPLDLK